jgi:hypothetical protein
MTQFWVVKQGRLAPDPSGRVAALLEGEPIGDVKVDGAANVSDWVRLESEMDSGELFVHRR